MPTCPTCGQPLPARLTPRQQEVLELLAEGLTTREMAARLHVAPKTVESHIAHMRQRARVAHRMALVLWAFREGLVAMPAREAEP